MVAANEWEEREAARPCEHRHMDVGVGVSDGSAVRVWGGARQAATAARAVAHKTQLSRQLRAEGA